MRDNAVSPVIGVILMVAITVILAAVIAAFVFGASQQVSRITEPPIPSPYTHKGYVMDLYQFEGVHYVDVQERGDITIYQVKDTVLAYHLREGQTILFTVAPWNVWKEQPNYPVIDSVRPWV